MPEAIRVATLNIWNRQGPWDQRARLIRRDLAALGADVVGLQEVLRFETEGAPDQAKELADGLGYATAFGSAWEIGGGLHFGNALLSRHPIVETHTFTLPDLGSGETRGLLYAVVDHPAGRVPVFVTHLNWKFHHGFVRVRQVAFVAEKVMELVPVGQGMPPILMGDFNAPPDADEIRFLKGLHVLDGKSIYFTDAWTYAGPAGPGWTFDRANAYTLSNREESRRIDYIFVRGPDKGGRGEPRNAALAFTEPEGDVWPSDHYGLVCDVTM
jgi:endonuclease/exonuclease/phosphatase family metal-dependent hydrolase